MPLRCAAPLLLSTSWLIGGIDVTTLKPEGFVSDFARVADPVSRRQVERYCGEIKEATGVELAFVTLRSLEGEVIEDLANRLYRQWGIGKKETHEGALLLLAVAERRSRLEVGYGLEPILPDGAAGEILRKMRPALREAHYGDAMILAAESLGARILQAKNKTATAPRPPQPSRQRPDESFPFHPGLLAGAAGLIAWIIWRKGRSSAWHSHRYGSGRNLPGILWALPWILRPPGHRSHRSSGGFGGYSSGSSGGGFGGFGGGSSGGGGASSSW